MTAPIAAIIHCPYCHLRHIDEGAWRTRPHHTHRCVGFGGCGKEWRVEPYCYGADMSETLIRS